MKPVLFLLGTSVFAQSMERPVLGYMQDARGAWHAVEGIAGSFLVGPATEASEYEPRVANRIENRWGTLYVVDERGSTVDILPREARLGLLTESALLYATAQELVIAGRARFPFVGITRLRAMSAEYVQVSTESGEHLVRVTEGAEAIFVLPAARAEARRR